MKRTYLVFFFLLTILNVYAQEAEKEKIYSIRTDSSYVSRESINSVCDSAFVDACQMLTMDVNNMLHRNLTYQQLLPVVQRINLKIGKSHRVFVYIHKQDVPNSNLSPDLTSVRNGELISTVQRENSDSVVPPKMGAYVPFSSTITEPHDSEDLSVGALLESPNDAFSHTVYDEVLNNLMPREMFNEVRKCVETYVKNGKLKKCGMFNMKLKEDYDNCYFIIVDRKMSVRAYLTPLLNGKRRNVATGKEDVLGNYSGCAAMWFR